MCFHFEAALRLRTLRLPCSVYEIRELRFRSDRESRSTRCHCLLWPARWVLCRIRRRPEADEIPWLNSADSDQEHKSPALRNRRSLAAIRLVTAKGRVTECFHSF